MRHLALLLALACGPKLPAAITPATSVDLGAVADQVVSELPDWGGFDRFTPRPRVVVLPTENRTKFKLDPDVATAKLVNGLIRRADGRFDVVDPQTWAALSAPPKKAPPPADPPADPAAGAAAPAPEGALLELQSEVQTTATDAGDGRHAVQVLVTYRLVESTSARALWAWSNEWTKARGEEGFEIVSPPRIHGLDATAEALRPPEQAGDHRPEGAEEE